MVDPVEYPVVFSTSDKGHMRLVYPEALLRLPTRGLQRDVFSVMCYWAYRDERNRDAVRKTRRELVAQCNRLHAEWDMVSITFGNEYRLEGDRHVEANNKRLIRTVKAAKRAFERMEKLLQLFDEAVSKYDCSNYLNTEEA